MVTATKENKTDTETSLMLPSITDQICQAARYWASVIDSMREQPYCAVRDRLEPLVREWFEIQFDTGMRKFYNEYDK